MLRAQAPVHAHWGALDAIFEHGRPHVADKMPKAKYEGKPTPTAKQLSPHICCKLVDRLAARALKLRCKLFLSSPLSLL